jgi:4-hydroxybenzoate polyprenyltransferase
MKKPSKSLIKSFIGFTKIEHTIFSVPLLFSAAFLSNGNKWPEISVMTLLILAATGARVLGMAMNRLIDSHFDSNNPRTRDREIPSGRLSKKNGYLIALTGFFVYLISCIGLGKLPLLLSPIPVIILIGYSYLKRITCLCHFGIGVVMALAPLGTSVAITGRVVPDLSVILLSTFAFLWISGFDIIYGLLDIDFDRKYMVHSIPARLGYQKAVWVARIIHLTAFISVVLLALKGRGTAGLTTGHLLLITVTGMAFILANSELLPVKDRFFPISAVSGVCGALISLL